MKVSQWLFTALWLMCVSSANADFEVERGVRQLFLDDVGIVEMVDVERVLHQPDRHQDNPLIVPDTPWERVCQIYGTAYYDEAAGKFKLWYLTIPKNRGDKPLVIDGRERAPHTTLAAYAESDDGIHWVKPSLGIFPYDGDTDNNLLGIGRYNCEGISVLHEPRDPDPKRRWKAVYWDHGSGGWEMLENGPYAKPGPKDGFSVAFSSDGLHWEPYEGNPVIKAYCDTNQNILFDPKIGKYVAFSRFGLGRKMARSESVDFIHWSTPEVVLECDAADGPQTQIYGAGVDLYEGVYIAMIWIYREGGDGKIDTQLATSRDGIHWTRVSNRATWLTLGADDSWEGGMARSTERIIRRGDTLYLYYCGVHGPHSGPKFKDVVRKYDVSIGLVTQRRDGFVSLRADGIEGRVLTAPFTLPEGNLYVNADISDGALTVELCDIKGNLLNGMNSSEKITGDVLRGKITWLKPLPETLPGQTVSLRFHLNRADFYSYWWE